LIIDFTHSSQTTNHLYARAELLDFSQSDNCVANTKGLFL